MAVTIHEARRLLDRHFATHPPAISGDLYIAREWREDDHAYLQVWGSRQFLVEGREAFARWDDLVIFIDKQTGEVTEEHRPLHSARIRKMTPVAVH